MATSIPPVAIIMGSRSDWPTMRSAADALDALGVAWEAKVDTYLLCQWQDRVAVSYYKSAQTAGKATSPPTATPPCSDPGAFAYVAPQSPKPLEVSGAHSPADTAVAPPSSKAVDAVLNPDKKP